MMISTENKTEKMQRFIRENAPSDAVIVFLDYKCWVKVPLDVKEYKTVSIAPGTIFKHEYTFQNELEENFSFESDMKPSNKTLFSSDKATIKRSLQQTIHYTSSKEEVLEKLNSLKERNTKGRYFVHTVYTILNFIKPNGVKAKPTSFWGMVFG